MSVLLKFCTYYYLFDLFFLIRYSSFPTSNPLMPVSFVLTVSVELLCGHLLLLNSTLSFHVEVICVKIEQVIDATIRF